MPVRQSLMHLPRTPRRPPQLTQLLLLTKLRDISSPLVLALQGSLEPHPAALTAPSLLSLHPGEVNTPFLDLMLPSWRCTWIEQMTCLTPRQGAWTGLWGCVIDLDGVVRPRLSGPALQKTFLAKDRLVDEKADVGYHYLLSLCTFGKPCSLARDAGLVRDCWTLVGDRITSFLENSTEKTPTADGLTLQMWEVRLGEVLKGSLK